MTNKSRFFLDTEFIEDGKVIDFLSIGIQAENGQSYYAINIDCDLNKASRWVQENVISQLPHKKSLVWRSKEIIAMEVVRFIKKQCVDLSDGEWATVNNSQKHLWELKLDSKPEFWGWYSATDWVVFYQLFGAMVDLPKGFPYRCNDLKQECDRLGNPKLPKQTEGKHNALEDAKWNKQVFDFLTEKAISLK